MTADPMPSSPAAIRWVPYEALAERQRASGAMRAVWAQHDADHVLVFQAFRPDLGRAAAAAGTLRVPGFSLKRATWIKPGFLWMMHRSDWGQSEGQEVVLGIHVARTWFEDALAQATLSSQRENAVGGRPKQPTNVVVQWDPDWDAADQRQPWRAIQIGLRPEAVDGYLGAITGCVDLSAQVAAGRAQRSHAGRLLVPDADVLPLADPSTRKRLGIDGK